MACPWGTRTSLFTVYATRRCLRSGGQARPCGSLLDTCPGHFPCQPERRGRNLASTSTAGLAMTALDVTHYIVARTKTSMKRSWLRGVGLLRMRPFLYRCPNLGIYVQSLLGEDEVPGRGMYVSLKLHSLRPEAFRE